MENQYTKPDLNASRNRNLPPDPLSYPEEDRHGYFTKLKQRYPHMAKYSNREIAIWIEGCNKLMADEVATSWDGVMLPEGLGFVIAGVCKPTKKTASNNIDFGTSNKLGKVVHHQNDHSHGNVAVIKYTNNIPWHRYENCDLWAFKPCRYLQRAVSKEMKEGRSNWHKMFSKYLTVDNLFRRDKTPKPTRKQKKVEKDRKKYEEDYKKMLAEYDEFDFTDIPAKMKS